MTLDTSERLLCWPCNSFLGRIQDSPERLLAYLGGKEVQP